MGQRAAACDKVRTLPKKRLSYVSRNNLYVCKRIVLSTGSTLRWLWLFLAFRGVSRLTCRTSAQCMTGLLHIFAVLSNQKFTCSRRMSSAADKEVAQNLACEQCFSGCPCDTQCTCGPTCTCAKYVHPPSSNAGINSRSSKGCNSDAQTMS